MRTRYARQHHGLDLGASRHLPNFIRGEVLLVANKACLLIGRSLLPAASFDLRRDILLNRARL
jgi:hypothetical protein